MTLKSPLSQLSQRRLDELRKHEQIERFRSIRQLTSVVRFFTLFLATMTFVETTTERSRSEGQK